MKGQIYAINMPSGRLHRPPRSTPSLSQLLLPNLCNGCYCPFLYYLLLLTILAILSGIHSVPSLTLPATIYLFFKGWSHNWEVIETRSCTAPQKNCTTLKRVRYKYKDTPGFFDPNKLYQMHWVQSCNKMKYSQVKGISG